MAEPRGCLAREGALKGRLKRKLWLPMGHNSLSYLAHY
jgi:hypothetical protein